MWDNLHNKSKEGKDGTPHQNTQKQIKRDKSKPYVKKNFGDKN